MKKLEILPSTLYEFDVPNDIYAKMLKNINDLDFQNEKNRGEGEIYYGVSTSGENSLHTNKKWFLIVDYINEQLKKVCEDVMYSKYASELKVCLMWCNKSEYMQWHHAHSHPCSILSGIIYISGTSGSTWFSKENPYALPKIFYPSKNIDINNQYFESIYKHKPKKQTMIIFPSSMIHSVDENMNKEESRITISFNSFFNGTVGNPNKLAGFNLKLN
jgi:uncharacterized protein (TIGR02466 family)